tara:strand:+ start:3209 stop:4654 length:1446 start_codon:yes stop_codon:yes gene_type:complete
MPKAHGLIHFDDIIINERQRDDDDKAKTFIDEELMPSIAEAGLIQPIILASDEKTLIAGWNRAHACNNLGYQGIAFNTQQDMPESQRLVQEYEENETRSSMSWQSKAHAIRKIHLRKKLESQEAGEKWGTRQAGKLMGVSHAYVSNFLKLSSELTKGNPGLEQCSTISEAIKYLYSGLEDRLHEELARKAAGPQSGAKPSTISSRAISSGPIEFNLDLSAPASPEPSGQINRQEGFDGFNVPMKSRFFQGDCLQVMQEMEPEQFDLIFTDIPYGIDMKNLEGIDGIDRVVDEHDVGQNVDQMQGFIEGSYRVLKDKSWMIFFFDLVHFEKLIKWSEDAGFNVQKYPLHWIKTHPCRNQSSHCSWTKTIEHVFVARKGTATMRNTNYTPNHFACEGLTEKKNQANPFAKPFDMCEWILDKVVFPGQTCLDPFAGEGSICRAEIVKGLVPYGIELSDKHYDRLCNNVREQYKLFGGEKVTFEG